MSVNKEWFSFWYNEKFRLTVFILFIPLSIFYMELVVQLHCFDHLMGWGVFYMFLFSMAAGLVILCVSGLFGKQVGHIIALVLMALLILYMSVQAVYFTVFKTFTTLSQYDMASSAMRDFGKEAMNGIKNTIGTIFLLLIPFILMLVLGNHFRPDNRIRARLAVILAVAAIAFQTTGTVLAVNNNEGVMSYKYVYNGAFAPMLSVPRFGLLTTARFEIRNKIFGLRNSSDTESPSLVRPAEDPESNMPVTENDTEGDQTEAAVEPEKVIEYGDNVLEIDFASLIANEEDDSIVEMHNYFKNKTPTKKNEHTGEFEGYNLIWIVAEGFSRYALDPKYTPTLYKLSNEGYVFDNFYNPIWYMSTSDGEYTTMTGLIPKPGIRSYQTSGKNYMPYGFGNMLKPLGYICRAYHNHTYDYYGRDISHPNMGYIYKGKDAGLNVTSQWPESDLEMMELTIPEYIGDKLFHTYYMTVSGHLEYNFSGNNMALKHKDDVQPMLDAGYSEPAAAYIACNMEFDQSVKYLIDELEKAGKLDNTLIVISGDHYPYGLEPSQMEELLGEPIDQDFEMYRTNLIIWNSKLETQHVEKYCCPLDVMPTLANLLGLDYDSRLIMGTDIFSDSPAMIEFENRSFITEYGRYNSKTDTFIPNEGVVLPDDYAVNMLQEVSDEFYFSAKILDTDYYAKVFQYAKEE